MNVGKCRDCGGAIIWRKTTTGKAVPLNPLPVNVALSITNDDDAPVAIKAAHKIHQTTCTKKHASVRA